MVGFEPDCLCLWLFFGITLGHTGIAERITYSGTLAKLPTKLNGDEIARVWRACEIARVTARRCGDNPLAADKKTQCKGYNEINEV